MEDRAPGQNYIRKSTDRVEKGERLASANRLLEKTSSPLEREILKIALINGYVTPKMLSKRLPQSYISIVDALRRMVAKGLLYRVDRGIYIPNCLGLLGMSCADSTLGDS